MRKQKTIFVCDECKKESKIMEDDFPYEDGWKYLYNLSFKTDKVNRRSSTDSHFCSKLCFELFIKKKIDLYMKEKK